MEFNKTEMKKEEKERTRQDKLELGKSWQEWFGEENSRGIMLKFLGRRVKEIKGKNFGVEIFDSILGKTMVIEEKMEKSMQTSEKYDFYDEILANVAMNSCKNPENVLIIGGGDGKIANEVIRYKPKRVVVVDPAREVFEATKDIFWEEKTLKKANIVFDNGENFVKNCKDKFDVIIGDFTDPYPGEKAEKLISEEFFRETRKILNKEGVFAFQSGSPLFQQEIVKRAFENARKVFENAKLFWGPSPIYPLGLWSFVICSENVKPIRKIKRTFYSSEIHKALFILPPFLETLVKSQK